jgi:hypothetical protein
LVSNII